METHQSGNDLHLRLDKTTLNIADTLDCGQCFRFKSDENGRFSGVAFSKKLEVIQTDEEIVFLNTTQAEYDNIWCSFFGLDVDYASIKSSLEFDKTIKLAMEFAGGIRILKQDSFEALCSFIISQNNNIPRIKGSVDKFCERFGKRLDENIFTFPMASDLEGLKKTDLTNLSLGYRDDYIVDCVQKISSGELSLSDIETLDIDTARKQLLSIKGVGPKVAECALLFGFHRLEAFPIDTWIKKVMQTYYQDGFPQNAKTFAGVAQQYLFHYIRKNGTKA